MKVFTVPLAIGILFSGTTIAQTDTSSYPVGHNQQGYMVPQQPIYIPKQQQYVQPVYTPQAPGGANDPRNVFMGNPRPPQRACYMAGNVLVCN